MARGEGRLFRHDRSRFWYVAYYNSAGKELREVARDRKGNKLENTDANEKAARDYLKKLVMAVGAESLGAPAFLGPDKRRQTVNDILDKLVMDYEKENEDGISRKVGPQMKSHLKRVRDFFGDTRAVGVSDAKVDEFKKHLRSAGLAKATVNRSLQLLKQSFKVAGLNAPLVEFYSEKDNVRKGKFSQTEVNRLLIALPEYLRDVAAYAYETGTRAGEILNLRWEYVKGDAIAVPGEITKNRESHPIDITPEICEILERRRKARVPSCPFIFHNAGHQITDYRKAWHSACVVTGLGKFYCRNCEHQLLDAKRNCPKCGRHWDVPLYQGRLMHDFRRSAAFELRKSGVQDTDAMLVTGHKSLSMYKRYSDLSSDEEKQATQRRAQEQRRAWREEQIVARAVSTQPGVVN